MPHLVHLDLRALEPDPSPLLSMSIEASLHARGLRRVVASTGPDDLVDALPLHGLLVALHVAYTRHRPFALSPDDVWLAIAQATATHVEHHAEALRTRLVRHAGKMRLAVRRDELATDPSSLVHWAHAVDDLVLSVREQLGGRADLFVARFSTTDACSRTASSIALLGGMSAYFEYVVRSLCGIPEVTLYGTPEDWADIRRRLAVIGDTFGGASDDGYFETWVAKLDPVLAGIEATARGEGDVAFWERAYKVHAASGGEAISGWVNALFPYLEGRAPRKNPWFEVGDDANELELPKLSHFPSGLTVAPFGWERLGLTEAMAFTAGFVGVARHGDEGVRPAIGWCVTPAAADRKFRAFPVADGLVMLSPREPITTLEGIGEQIALDGHARVDVSLSWANELSSLEGVASSTAIERVSLLACNALVSLEGLAASTSLRDVRVQQCDAISDLSPLVGMRLERLGVAHCKGVRDYGPIARMERLVALDLFGDTVPVALRGRHEGREAVAAIQRAIASLA